MDKKLLMKMGDSAVIDALSDMFAILNGQGEILSKLGGDRMVFSPRLECDGECSTMLFDDEDGARHVIDDILVPQDDASEFHVFKFSPTECDMCDDCECDIEVDDGDGCTCDICGCEDCQCNKGCACDGDGSDAASVTITVGEPEEKDELSCAIEKFRDEGDETTASWLEELKMRKESEKEELQNG